MRRSTLKALSRTGVTLLVISGVLAGCRSSGEQPSGSSQPAEDPSAKVSSCDEIRKDAVSGGQPIPGMDASAIPRRGGTLRIWTESDPTSLNRLISVDGWVKQIVLHDLQECLIRQDSQTYEIRPELASRWEVDESGLNITFHLREGVKWHDGTPFTSKDVKTTFDLIFDPRNPTDMVRSDWTGVLQPAQGYEAPDDKTFVLHLVQKNPLLFANLDILPILPAHIFGKGTLETHPNNRNPVGTGPYRFVSWQNDVITLERNPDYWGRPAYLDRLEYHVIKDRDTAFAVLQRGELDFMDRLPPVVRAEGITPQVLEKYRLVDAVSLNYQGWIFNLARPIFADVRTRRALSMLINREQAISEVFLCFATPISAPIPTSHPAYDKSIPLVPFDPEGAVKLLEEVGWIDRDGDGVRDKEIDGQSVPLSFTMLATPTSTATQKLLTLAQSTMRQAGVELKIEPVDYQLQTQRTFKGDFDAVGSSWMLNHDLDFYPMFHSQGGQNLNKYHSPRMDAVLDRVRFELDPARSNELLREAHKIFAEELPWTPLFFAIRSFLVRKDVQGLYVSDHWYQEYDMWLNDPKFPEVAPEDRHPGAPGAPPRDATGR